VVAVACSAALVSACDDDERCGPGEVDVGGGCVLDADPICRCGPLTRWEPPYGCVSDFFEPVGLTPAVACCGPGTELDPGGFCVATAPAITCEPSRSPRVNEVGDWYCGPFGPGACGPPCPPPEPGNVAVCGRFVEAETAEPIDSDDATGESCDPENPSSGGPCALSVTFHSALQYAADPSSAPAIVPASMRVTDCGWFAAELEEPELGFLAVVVDRNAELADTRVPTVHVLPAPQGSRLNGLIMYSVRRATDAAWTATAGDPFGGQTFADRGAVLATYLHAGAPVAGVQVVADGEQPQSDFYFADTDPWTRTTVDPALDATGVNGSALLVDSPFVDHSGGGGEPPGCYWPESLATGIAGTIMVQRFEAECP
jgi:hypothetical protein